MLSLFDALWPYALMAGTAFLAATLLPFSSELALIAQIKSGLGTPAGLIVAATIGNVAGSTFNWGLGRALRRYEGRRWFPFKPEDITRATALFNRYGAWTLLLAWVPVVGDPLTLVAGILRVPLGLFLLLVTIGKALRYAVIASIL